VLSNRIAVFQMNRNTRNIPLTDHILYCFCILWNSGNKFTNVFLLTHTQDSFPLYIFNEFIVTCMCSSSIDQNFTLKVQIYISIFWISTLLCFVKLQSHLHPGIEGRGRAPVNAGRAPKDAGRAPEDDDGATVDPR
jgi:hypothetical protein